MDILIISIGGIILFLNRQNSFYCFIYNEKINEMILFLFLKCKISVIYLEEYVF